MFHSLIRCATPIIRTARPSINASINRTLLSSITVSKWQHQRMFSTEIDEDQQEETVKPKRTRRTPEQIESERAGKQADSEKQALKKQEKEKAQLANEKQKEKAQLAKEKQKEKTQLAKQQAQDKAKLVKEKLAMQKAQKAEKKAKDQEDKAAQKRLDTIERNRPKRPMTPYTLFVVERYESVKQSNPTLTMAEIGKIMGAQYRELSAEEKEKYAERVRTEFLPKFEKERADYLAQHPHPPKKPGNSFVLYILERRPALAASNPAMSMIDLSKTCSQEWKSMSDDDKAKYRQQYYDAVVKYRQELNQWESVHGALPRRKSAPKQTTESSDE